MGKIEVKNITKQYHKGKATLKNFSLDIEDGQFLVLLGPSGCGKSTLLRIIAGLEPIEEGKVIIDGQDVTLKKPKDRNIAMVFQNYALYPHMSVYKNIAVALELQKLPKKDIDEKVQDVAKILELEELLERKPRQLSGGQMQRVALARAMIRNPKVFLMDEPLSNLDAKLRSQTRIEILELYNRLKTTTIFVTHDQSEAMTMATTIVLMNEGKIMAKGTPQDLYNKPPNVFTANFIGNPPMNMVKLKLEEGCINLLGKTLYLNLDKDEVMLGLRPEALVIENTNDYNGTVSVVENLGNEKHVHIIDDGGTMWVTRCGPNVNIDVGMRCFVSFDCENVHVFDVETENRLELVCEVR